MDVILGLDTSCYTTSAALVSASGQVLGAEGVLLPVQQGKRGLRQSEAVFAHVRQMPLVMERLMTGFSGEEVRICAVAASAAPRGEKDSYMPVFMVGYGQAQSLSSALGIPCYRVSHQQGHVAAGRVGGPPLGERFVALHLSGGTTEVLLWEDGQLHPLGGTLDLHAGQLVDRAGVAMGLSFPAGPALEALALQWPHPAEALLPLSLCREDLYCHFSGAETHCMQWIAQGTMPFAQIAMEVYDLLARTVARVLVASCKKTGEKQALIVGGVASSQLLRRLLTGRMAQTQSCIQVVFGKPEYSGDNAVGVASLGVECYRSRKT